MIKKILTLSIIILFQNFSFSQNFHVIDSLQTLLKTAKQDTNRVKLLIEISGEYAASNATESFKYNSQCLALISKLSHQKNSTYVNEYLQLAKSNIYSLFVFTYIGVYDDPKKAMEYILKALAINEKLTKSSNKYIANQSLESLAKSYFQMGNNYFGLQNDSALKYYSKALPILLKIENKELLPRVYQYLARISNEKKDFEKSSEYMNLAVETAKYIKQKRDLALFYNFMGRFYVNKAKTEKNNSIFYYNESLKYYFKAIKEAHDENNKNLESWIMIKIAKVYIYKKQFALAKEYALKGLALVKESEGKIDVAFYHKELADIYAELKEYKNAYINQVAYSRINDSLTTIKINSSVSDVEIKYKLDKQHEKEVLLFRLKQADAKAESKKQQLIIIFTGIGLFLVLAFAGFVFRSLRLRNQQNKIINEQKDAVENQKHLVEAKNKEIIDSIKYALRIQTAILPQQKVINQYLENSFILYKPKDIVAGDFYWMDSVKLKQNGEEVILFAACDCTGHGVPGAMVSVICHNALNRAVREFGLTQPAAILDKTAEIVLENFSKSEDEIYDGMDISICALNTKTKTLEWAGANNPLYIVQSLDGKSQNENNFELETLNFELIETKADKQCIGHNEKVKPFTNHQFNLQPDTSIYLFTDGFADQFGGQPEKKLTKSKFKELLLSIQNFPIQQQAKELDTFISNYKKDTEQTDDILVIGVRV